MKKKNVEISSLSSFFIEFNKLSSRISKEISRNLNIQDTFAEFEKRFSEAARPLYEKAAVLVAKNVAAINSAYSYQPIQYEITGLSPLVPQIEHLHMAFQERFAPVFKPLNDTFQELRPRTKKALILLGNYGWYLDMDLPYSELLQLTDALEAGHVKEAEEALVDYYERRLPDIEKSIIKRFPNRAKIIKSAFNAHRRREYDLSIPVLLIQADGICKEVTNNSFFRSAGKRPRTATYVDHLASDSLVSALLSPLATTLPINVNEFHRPAGSCSLNRHLVLHGESLDYGNKNNSLKTISLINYVAHVLVKRDPKP